MEAVKGLLRRRGYEKISRRTTTRRRVWRRIKLKAPKKIKIKFKLSRLPYSPNKILLWLRDAYVKLMNSFANSRVCAASSPVYGGPTSFARPLKEYDDKMLMDIYRSVMLAQALRSKVASDLDRGSNQMCGSRR